MKKLKEGARPLVSLRLRSPYIIPGLLPNEAFPLKITPPVRDPGTCTWMN